MFSKKKLYVIGFISLLVLSVNVISYGGEKGNNISNGEKKMKEEIKKRREKARANLDKLIGELRNGPEIAGREFAAIDLGIAEDPRAIPALIEAMKNDPVLSVRKEAINALGMIGDKSAIPALKEGLKDEEIKFRCASVLFKLGERKIAWSILVEGIKKGKTGLTWLADLGEKGDTEAVELLKIGLNSEDEKTRKFAKEYLEEIIKIEKKKEKQGK